MSAQYNIMDHDKHGPITERFWADLQHQLQIGSQVGLENEQLRPQIGFLENRRDYLDAYEAMYRRMIENQDQIIRSLRLTVGGGSDSNNAADEIAIDPALSVNLFKYEISNSNSQASTVSENDTSAQSPENEGLQGSDV
ncbi:hypothetical protein FOXG_21377 [Fusarium oxysporum f. sp. lycopersici 4287]|uniref:Uncharacterized protein n=1 Tax=Fusarium oxysporum f. sp. lycopersici (strain 4287 / CBS 123668 / FGSC 9935 / NRRL 34936) TaxID=426428 RepID=A0A0J9WS75_FUSO4|nr:hypothetical protein FOXG_20925 [Fusarium oxysporum f. sp. lycopersici 4287]XP_018253602.1 hypothetical protein FOXG_21377 [Fusarium oxysporum f. sp. lycopersici 4287]EWZ79215.1 hypothetical protein FOWG_16659 [Fusarium oxysporum f. sp. lycopersici MN25]KNB13792.1 hypothetical protein FOXG_20925 [Fusarium oxysporum f. sp. lycopersici 4287]KNB15557.1 hypothetical protein FOXG_21377 [Fusarium oxysporum f. sp. lycopersici 4287]